MAKWESLEEKLKDCTKTQAWNKGYAEGSRDQIKANEKEDKRG